MTEFLPSLYFINHIAKSIQLPEVIAGIARDLMRAIDAEFPDDLVAGHATTVPSDVGKSVPELVEGVYRDRFGRVRLIESDPSYARMVNRAFDKVRQSARGMRP